MGNKSGIDINVHQMERNHDQRKARGFSRSIRGKFIISQALTIAINHLKKLEERKDPYPKYGEHAQPSNRADMEYLKDKLYPIYDAVPFPEEALEEFGGKKPTAEEADSYLKEYADGEPTTADEYNLDPEKPDDEPEYYDENNEEYVK